MRKLIQGRNSSSSLAPLRDLCGALFSRQWFAQVERIIGRPGGLDEDVIDFAAQRYDQGDYLLCHDDRLEDRRVAFVLYLVDPSWSGEKDGGQLEFLYTDPWGRPDGSKRQIVVPRWNTLVFFEVAMMSHHQICEILGNLPRLSLAGWFHDSKKILLPELVNRAEVLCEFFDWNAPSNGNVYESFASVKFQELISQSLPCPLQHQSVCDLDGIWKIIDYPQEPEWIKVLQSRKFQLSISCMLKGRLEMFTRPILLDWGDCDGCIRNFIKPDCERRLVHFVFPLSSSGKLENGKMVFYFKTGSLIFVDNLHAEEFNMHYQSDTRAVYFNAEIV